MTALRKPRRAAPTLLSLPNRAKIETLFSRSCLIPHTLVAIELERRQTLAFGDVAILTAFVKELGLAKVEHMMPSEFTERQIESGAEVLGQTVMRQLRANGVKPNAGRQRIAGGI